MAKKFIDISEHNTILSFDRLNNSSLSGVIIKATEGTTYIDHNCDNLYQGINGSKPIGFYHYLTSTSEPETQAQNFWKKIQDKHYQILPVLDVEQESLSYKAQPYSERFIAEFYRLSGQNMIIYSGRCYITDHFDVSFRNNHLWWVADYSANDTPSILGCRVIAWQYTESSSDYDFSLGDLDCNILVDEDSFFLEPNEIPFSDESVLVDDYDSILQLQKELNAQCFTDYKWDELTEDGLAGDLTLSACPTLSVGAKGNITAWVQRKLGINADGVFGEQTRQAVIEFQSSRMLQGDGIVGKKTWSKLLGMRG